MRAIQFDTHGGPDVLRLVDLAQPEPGPGEILIAVQSASVNWSDTMRRRNDPYPFPTPLPFVPGGEVAGTVAALGEGVEGPPVGTPVFALVGGDGSGGYAEHAVASAPMVVPRPDHVPADEAAAIMIAGGTAMLLLRQAAALEPGQSVLIEGAGGGVGTAAIQIAKALGAGTVIGAAGSPDRRQAALDVGADHVVDYSIDGWADEVRELTDGAGVDIALETVGGPALRDAFSSLAPFGRMVVYGYASGTPGALTAEDQFRLYYQPVVNQSVIGFNVGLWFGLRPEASVAALTGLIGMVADGRVKVRIGERLPLGDAARAHELLESRGTVGKIVLHP